MNKNFLGGMFKSPSLRNVKNILKEKLGYMPRENVTDYPKEYNPEIIIGPPFIKPAIYFLLRKNF